MKTDNVLMTVAVIAVVVSVLGMGITYNYFTTVEDWLTGFGVIGSVNLTVETLAAINFSTTNISFGSGQIDSGQSIATLVSSNGSITNGDWGAPGNGMVIENIGNLNVTLDIATGLVDVTFIGGSSGGGPRYEWNITNGAGEADSCTAPGNLTMDTYENVSNVARRICDSFNFQDAQDIVQIDILLAIPDDSLTGALTDTITATFAAVS